MTTKICFKCNAEKLLSEYYRHPKTKDGLLNKCKSCTKKDSAILQTKKTSTPEGLEKERARQREKYYRLNYKEKHKPSSEAKRIIIARYNSKYPEKIKAKNISNVLKRIVKGNHLHHWNYNVEFAKDVIELSKSDHAKAHRFLKYDQTTFMYKDLDGNLLDTREKHENYIRSVL